MFSSHVKLEILLLRQADQIITLARTHASGDLKAALADIGTVLKHWLGVLEGDDDPPHQVQRHD